MLVINVVGNGFICVCGPINLLYGLKDGPASKSATDEQKMISKPSNFLSIQYLSVFIYRGIEVVAGH